MKEKEKIAMARLGTAEVGTILAWYLNGQLVRDPNHPDPPEWDAANRSAIAELVAHLQTLDVLNNAAGTENTDSDFTSTLLWINTFLSQYNATPGLEAYRGLPTWQWNLCLHAHEDEFSPKAIELKMMTAAMEIARAERISSLKLCAHCGQWLFARFSHQRFCTDGKCKEEFHSSNPADKRRRAKWMRDNYKEQKRKRQG